MLTASQIWTSPLYNDAVLKWTSTVSSQLLAGSRVLDELRAVRDREPGWHQPGAGHAGVVCGHEQVRHRPAARSGAASAADRAAATPIATTSRRSASYVTGSHNIKAGFQYNWGPYENTRDTNADLQQRYTNGVPTPGPRLQHTASLPGRGWSATSGIYAQDSWSLEPADAQLRAALGIPQLRSRRAVLAGRPLHRRAAVRRHPDARSGRTSRRGSASSTTCSATPRRRSSSASTATTSRGRRSSPTATTRCRLLTQALSWTDLNTDDIAQGERGCVYLTPGCEINFAQLPTTFGTPRLNTVDPDFKRVYNLETTAGIQHELVPRVSVSANWYRRSFHRLRITDNLLRTMDDYRAYNVFHPMTGQPFTIYDVTTAALSARRELRHQLRRTAATSTTPSTSTINTRLPGGAMLFGGFVTERNLRNICDEPDDPNMLLFCDDSRERHPLPADVEAVGHVSRCRGGITVSGTWQDLAGRPLGLTTTPARSGGHPKQDQRSGLRRHRQPGGHELVPDQHDALSGQLPGALSGGTASISRSRTPAGLGAGRGPDRRARDRVPAAPAPARPELRQVVRVGGQLAPPGAGRHLQRVQRERQLAYASTHFDTAGVSAAGERAAGTDDSAGRAAEVVGLGAARLVRLAALRAARASRALRALLGAAAVRPRLLDNSSAQTRPLKEGRPNGRPPYERRRRESHEGAQRPSPTSLASPHRFRARSRLRRASVRSGATRNAVSHSVIASTIRP